VRNSRPTTNPLVEVDGATAAVAVQVPLLPDRLQERKASEQLVSQHTPSAQLRDWQVPLSTQSEPLGSRPVGVAVGVAVGVGVGDAPPTQPP
jgi:hypothetical protein